MDCRKVGDKCERYAIDGSNKIDGMLVRLIEDRLEDSDSRM